MNKKNLLLSMLLSIPMMFNMTSCNNNKVLKIGVLQYAPADALSNAYEGFKEVIEENFEAGTYEIDFRNAQGESANNAQAAASLITSCDLVLGIATPSATALQAEAYLQQKDTPILFTAVTDAVNAGLVESNEHPGGNITGTSDMNPVSEQIDLIKEAIPDITTLGMIYCSSESNSLVQYNLAKDRCDTLGINLLRSTITSSSDISTAITTLVNDGIQAIYLPTDNMVANNIATVALACQESQTMMFAAEVGMLSGGAHISLSIDYKELGKLTGEMAVDIIKNYKKPGDLAVKQLTNCPLYINQSSIDAFELTLPQSIQDRAININ